MLDGERINAVKFPPVHRSRDVVKGPLMQTVHIKISIVNVGNHDNRGAREALAGHFKPPGLLGSGRVYSHEDDVISAQILELLPAFSGFFNEIYRPL